MNRLLLALLLCAMAPLPALAASSTVPAAVTEALSKGINIENWFSSKTAGGALTPAEMREIKRLGLKHVRLVINPELIVNDEAATLERINLAIRQLNDAGLLVIADFHASHRLTQLLKKDHVEGTAAACGIWQTLGRSLARTSPKKVVLELYNEPNIWDYRWGLDVPVLINCVRQVAPRHTLLVGGTWMNHWAALKKLPAVSDTNIVYTFHYYDPMMFTHQGASWLGSPTTVVKNVPFPARMTEDMSATLAQFVATSNTALAHKMLAYVSSSTGADAIARDFASIKKWQQQRGNPPVAMTEFGVITKAPAADRAVWINTVRTAAEQQGFGWTMWDYSSAFGLYKYRKHLRMLDPDVANALGLQVSPTTP
jgi:hypothetical protein